MGKDKDQNEAKPLIVYRRGWFLRSAVEMQRCVMRNHKITELKKRIDHEAKASAYYSGKWHDAYDWHMDNFMAACKERDELLNA